MKKNSIYGVIALMSFSSLAGAKVPCPKNIKIGWDEYKPYQFEEAGKVTGSDMKIFSLLMNKLGCEFTAEKTPWERTLMEVEAGKMLFAAGATVTSERLKFAYFSIPYDIEKIYPYVLKKNLNSLKLGGVDEILMAGYKIVTTAGATYGDDFDALVKGGKLVKEKNHFEVPDEKQAAELLTLGRVDIFIASGAGLTFHPEVVNGNTPVFSTEARFMLSKKLTDKAFVKDVDRVILDLQKDYSIQKIKDKFFKNTVNVK